MQIYTFETNCYNCHKNFSLYTYLLFREYDLDVEFPLDMNLVRRVYAEMPEHKDNPWFDEKSDTLNFPIKILGDDDYYDSLVIDSGHFPYIQNVYSKMACKRYAANICPYCGAFTGNYHLREIITLNYLRPNIPMKKHVEI